MVSSVALGAAHVHSAQIVSLYFRGLLRRTAFSLSNNIR